MMLDLSAVDFAKGGGTITVVAQDANTGSVLMVAHADREALERTIETGEMHYRSRTRGLWHKGATSGNVQRVISLAIDCDGDAVLARVDPAGPACHNGTASCFSGEIRAADPLDALDRTIEARASAARPDGSSGMAQGAENTGAVFPRAPERPSYTQRLLADRNLRLKKLGEEAAELVTACADGDAARVTEEAADLVYHTLVAMRSVGVGIDELRNTLAARAIR